MLLVKHQLGRRLIHLRFNGCSWLRPASLDCLLFNKSLVTIPYPCYSTSISPYLFTTLTSHEIYDLRHCLQLCAAVHTVVQHHRITSTSPTTSYLSSLAETVDATSAHPTTVGTFIPIHNLLLTVNTPSSLFIGLLRDGFLSC